MYGTHKNTIKYKCINSHTYTHSHTCGQTKVSANGGVHMKMHLIPLKVIITLINCVCMYVCSTTSLSNAFAASVGCFPTCIVLPANILRCNLIANRHSRHCPPPLSPLSFHIHDRVWRRNSCSQQAKRANITLLTTQVAMFICVHIYLWVCGMFEMLGPTWFALRLFTFRFTLSSWNCHYKFVQIIYAFVSYFYSWAMRNTILNCIFHSSLSSNPFLLAWLDISSRQADPHMWT